MKKNIGRWLGLLGALTAAQSSAFAQQWGDADELKEFLDRTQVVTNAKVIETSSLMSGSLLSQPWSSTFWPDMNGSVAFPYADISISIPVSWSMNRPRVVSRVEDHARNVDSLSDDQINNMSPAEKYDMLLGDRNFTFSRQIIARVDQLNDIGLLTLKALWSGICHGWSPASLTMDRPLHAINMMAPNGRNIPFYPADIKALEDIAWGDAFGPGGGQSQTKMKGDRCLSGSHTNKYGRLVDPKCFNVNPGMLHLILVNQIGLNRRGFVMNRAYTAEVQNQPVFAYSFKFFKANDRHQSTGLSFEDAKIYYSSGFWDPYKQFRSPRAVALVGVEALVYFGKENDPNHDLNDDTSKDHIDHLDLKYDLELDANNEIVGGEWREYADPDGQTLAEQITYTHPGFVWLVPAGVKAWSLGDWDIQNIQWNGDGVVPPQFLPASIKSTLHKETETFKSKQVEKLYPQPLLKVVDALVAKSRR